MPTFLAKPDVSADKMRGGYYTPEPVARFLARWVSEAGSLLLEPSCGDGQVLRELAAASNLAHGVELIDEEAEKARAYASVDTSSLFDWLDEEQRERWDGVAGNPPYIRFGNWDAGLREPALRLMQAEGLKPSKLTNAWVPFVVGSTIAVKAGGRVGLVLPAELLQVTYAAQLRNYLLEHFSEITLVTFEQLVFGGILQEVVLFLGIKGESAARIRTVHLAGVEDLDHADLEVEAAPALLHDHEKWTKYFLAADQVTLLRDIRASNQLATLGALASVDVGIVTGRNSFFTFTDAEVRDLGLDAHCRPLVSRSSQLTGLVYDMAARESDLPTNLRTWILDAKSDASDPPLTAHIEAGEAAEVHLGYKCSLRRPWWTTPSVWVPDAFMLRQIHRVPRLSVNETDATSTDTVHRVRIADGVDVYALAAVFHNSATFAFAEILGRSYGGGILELEPREAELLPVPRPEFASAGLVEKVDALLKEGHVDEAVRLVDQEVLVGHLRWTQERVDRCNAAWVALRDRRTLRGRPRRIPLS